ncbi:MAG: PTS sugar transporter subunit IIA [Planctomycetes bacterium]|nr:PTS sugar transporter subunit IIA [Planctomycetota bacterium]
MRLIEIIGSEGILPDLNASFRDEAFLEIVDQLVATGRFDQRHKEDLLMALLKRESLGATSIGNHVAIPHVKTELVKEFVGAIAISKKGIDFAPGEEKVHVIILFLSPARAVSGHLRLLAHIGGILNHDGYVRLLRDAEGKSEILDLVRDAERMIFGDPSAADEDGDDRQPGKDPVLA